MKKFRGIHHGSLPLNARITVDYAKGKVRFSYPRRVDHKRARKNAFVQLYCVFLLSWMMVNGIGAIVYMIVSVGFQLAAEPLVIDWGAFLQGTLYGLGVLVYVSGPPFLATYIIVRSEKLMARLFPKLNAQFARVLQGGAYEAVFRRTSSKTVEIPLFRNVALDYKAVGEFGQNLERIEIREHPFVIRRRNGRTEPNDRLWKAVFLFKRDCNSGYLKVSFV